MTQPKEDAAGRIARHLVESWIGKSNDELRESIAAYFRNYEIEIAMHKQSRIALQETAAKASVLGKERSTLLNAILDFNPPRHRHAGPHSIIGSDGRMKRVLGTLIAIATAYLVGAFIAADFWWTSGMFSQWTYWERAALLYGASVCAGIGWFYAYQSGRW